jgi:hypothetical protein
MGSGAAMLVTLAVTVGGLFTVAVADGGKAVAIDVFVAVGDGVIGVMLGIGVLDGTVAVVAGVYVKICVGVEGD